MARSIRVSRQYPPPDIVIRSINAATTRSSARIEIYEQDGAQRWANDTINRLIDGSVSIDYSRDERRTLDLTLDNFDNILVSAPGYFWYDKIIKVYRQVRVRTSTYDAWEFQLGEFMIDSIDEDNFPHQVKIQGRDYAKKLMLSKFTTTTQFTGSYSLEYLVGTIASNGGIVKMILPTTGVTIKDATFNRGSTRWAGLKQICADQNYDIYFDNNGYLRLTPQPDPFTQPPVYTFLTGANAGNLASYSKSTDDTQLYNHVLVIGKDTSGSNLPPYAEAINTDPDSPTNIYEIGDRLYEWDSDTITYRFNYSPNPSARSNVTSFGSIAGTSGTAAVSQSSAPPNYRGSQQARVTWSAASTAAGGGIYQQTLANSVVAGEKVSARAYIYSSLANRLVMQFAFYDSSDALISTSSGTARVILINTWAEYTLENVTAPANTNYVRVQVVSVAGSGYVNWSNTSFIQMDAILIEKAAAIGAYFDGGDTSCFWTGTTNNSTSISNQQAQAVADGFLKIHALEQFSISLEALNHFYLDVGQVVEFDDPRPAPGDPTRFLLQSLTIPIKLGTMSGQAGRVLNVGGG